MSIFFGLLFARRFYCCPALSLSPGRTGGLFPRINAPITSTSLSTTRCLIGLAYFFTVQSELFLHIVGFSAFHNYNNYNGGDNKNHADY